MRLLMMLATTVLPAQDPELPFPDFTKHAEVFAGAATKIEDTRYLVVGDADTWRKLWREHDPDSAAPPVDFATSLMLCVFHPQEIDGGFRIDRIARGALASQLWSYNVFLKDDPAPNRYCMVRVDRTRLGFRFYAQGNAPTVSKAKLVARREVESRHQPAASLREATLALLDEYLLARRKGEAVAETLARLTALGDPIRPLLRGIVEAEGHERRFGAATDVLAAMDRQEIEAAGRPVRHSEIALGKALAEVKRRIDVQGEPWYAATDVRRQGEHWFIAARGTFAIFSDWEVAHQKDVIARVALRARDGRVVHCAIRRGGLEDGLVEKNAPGVVPVEDK